MSHLRSPFGRRSAALGRAARRLRPTTGAGWLKAAAAAAGMVAVLAVGAIGLVIVGPWVYEEYGYHPEANARAWAALTPQYADSILCARCHTPELFPWEEGRHAGVTCESCHGPLALHAATAPVKAEDAEAPIEIEKPPADMCAACHATAVGRPAGFPAVDLAAHYDGGICLACHDPHAASALLPPDISHPLANLPACTTCHAPAGLKSLPAGHVESPDAVCRSCHLPMVAEQ